MFKQPAHLYEIETPEGLEIIAQQELNRLFNTPAKTIKNTTKPGTFGVYFAQPRTLLQLQTITAVYLVIPFSVPRPRALLGHEHFSRLSQQIDFVQSLHPEQTFQTFHLDAAGSDSTVMNRIKETITQHTKLAFDPSAGDLLIKLRGALYSKAGWEALIRLSPRPLSTRSWRVCNYEGALNAAVAHSMVTLTQPQADDHFLNIGCGSGTLLIERHRRASAVSITGCDTNPAALHCAQNNIYASGAPSINILYGDARKLPFSTHTFNALCADLPFGQLIGTHQNNKTLYPALLEEAARVAKTKACFVIITHEIRLMEAVLQQSPHWIIKNVLKITLRGLHPRIFVLEKTTG